MGQRARTDDLLKLREKKEKEIAKQSATVLIFRKMAEAGDIGDSDIVAHATLFELWKESYNHKKGCIRRCPEDGRIYKCIREPRSSIKAPSLSVENWKPILVTDLNKSD